MKWRIPIACVMLPILFSCDRSSGKPEIIVDPGPSRYSCAPLTTDAEWYKSDNTAPLFTGLDAVDYPITTGSASAQQYFNQGLVLSYGFNHAEAARSFYYATRLDPDCAMCYWGYAYVLGPNYNAGMEDDNYERAYDAVQTAIRLTERSDLQFEEREKMLIRALSKRYTEEPAADRSALDIAYSKAMEQVAAKFPEDADINALYAESVMDLHPWDLYEKDGSPKSWTPGVVATIEHVFEIDPRHPGANHFYIHAVEASNTPERGLPSAELLDNALVPGSGHLVHMPSHIYIRTGDYHKGTLANIRAVQADSSYVTLCHAQGAYPLAYYPHNYHFLTATATLAGNSKWAIAGARKVADQAHKDVMKEPGWGTLQHFYTIPYFVYVKFERWDEILEMENFDPTLKYPEAVRHYARGMAQLGKGDIEAALMELESLEAYAADTGFKSLTIWDINTTYTLLQIARRVLKGEIMAGLGNYEEAIDLLKAAAEIEDGLNYDEPPPWFFSVRHHLGAVQMEAGWPADATETYLADLAKFPRNGWSLSGLQTAYEAMGESGKADAAAAKAGEAWAMADVFLDGSRIR